MVRHSWDCRKPDKLSQSGHRKHSRFHSTLNVSMSCVLPVLLWGLTGSAPKCASECRLTAKTASIGDFLDQAIPIGEATLGAGDANFGYKIAERLAGRIAEDAR